MIGNDFDGYNSEDEDNAELEAAIRASLGLDLESPEITAIMPESCDFFSAPSSKKLNTNIHMSQQSGNCAIPSKVFNEKLKSAGLVAWDDEGIDSPVVVTEDPLFLQAIALSKEEGQALAFTPEKASFDLDDLKASLGDFLDEDNATSVEKAPSQKLLFSKPEYFMPAAAQTYGNCAFKNEKSKQIAQSALLDSFDDEQASRQLKYD